MILTKTAKIKPHKSLRKLLNHTKASERILLMVLNKTVKDQTTQKPEKECLLMVLKKTVKDESTQSLGKNAF